MAIAEVDRPDAGASGTAAAGKRGHGRGRHGKGAAPSGPKPPSLSAPIKKDIIGGLLGTWAMAIVIAIFLVLVGKAMDRVLTGESIVGVTLIALLIVVAARAFLGWLVPVTGAKASGELEIDMRGRVYRSVMGQGATVRSQEQTGKVVSTGTQSVELASTFYATFLGPIIASMTTPLVVLVVIAIAIDVRSALILLGFVVLIPLTVGFFQRGFQKVSDNYTAQSSRLSARFLDALQGLPTLALFNQGKAYGASLAKAAEEVRVAIMRLLLGNQIVLFVVDAVFSLGMITVASALAMTRLRDGAITPGQALSLVLLGLLLIEPLDKVGQFFYVGMSGIAGARDVRTQLAQAPNADALFAGAASSSHAKSGSAPGVSVRGVSFAYDPARPVLRDVSFHVGSGEHLAIVGPSGSGKTTVANLLMRFLDAGSGEIGVCGLRAGEVPDDLIRAQIAYVGQTTFLFTGTLADNLRIANAGATDAQLREALGYAQLTDFVAALPAGLDTEVGERGLAVSGGQAQRIAIARAFLKNAPVLLLDEPTSNVDAASEAALVEAIDRLRRGRTVITIAHRLSTIRDADTIVVLDEGRVVEAGSHEALVAAGGRYARAVGRWQEGASR
jgi:ABC-type multidrug transport system fused ATPase/permease subunit